MRRSFAASSGKRRATRHALFNLAAVACFGAAWLVRADDRIAGPSVVGLEAIGGALLLCGGWLGGTLVTRNLIGIDHRYAGAGAWQDERVDVGKEDWISVGRKDDLAVDQMKLIRADARRIALGRTETDHVAFEDRCTHRGGSLAGGVMICGTVQCLWHGSQFDAATGQVKCGPAKKAIRTYKVRTTGDDLQLKREW